MAGGEAPAPVIEQETGEQACFLRGGAIASMGAVPVEPLLDLLPEILIDDGFVLSAIAVLLMGNPADIEIGRASCRERV
jgi:hypothetical protein